MRDLNKALNYSFLLLKYRARSTSEIIQRLKLKQYDSSIIKQTIQYLEENNYINDEEFANSFVASAFNEGWGRRKIEFRLKQLGIAQRFREQALAKDYSFDQKLKEIVKEKLHYLRKQRPPLSEKAVWLRLRRHLLTRGFRSEEIFRQIESLGVNQFEDA